MRSKNLFKCLIANLLILAVIASFCFDINLFPDKGGTSVAYAAQFSEISNDSRRDDYAKYLAPASNAVSHPFLKADDIVEVVVEMTDNSLIENFLETGHSNTLKEYIKTSAGASYNKSLFKKQDALRESMLKTVDAEYLYGYTAILNGFAAKIKYGDISKVLGLSGVKNVIVAEQYSLPAAVSVDNPVNVDSVTGIYDSSDVGFDGSGTIIGILDTGLDYYHAAFQTLPDKLVKTLEDVEDIISESAASAMQYELTSSDVYVSDKIPFAFDYGDYDSDVFPTNSHGTHVAGIIAGQDDVITGVAPNAQLAIFKVSSNNASTMTDVAIFSALNDAVLLGVDVINMSLGTTAGFAQEAEATAVDNIYSRITRAGINLIVAAGNESNSSKGGAYGDTNLATNPDSGTVGSPASLGAAMSIASINGLKSTYLEANGSIPIYITESTNTAGKNNNFLTEMERLYGALPQEVGYVIVPGVGRASNYATVDVTGKIAIVQRGDLTFEEKAKNAADKGAIACIIYNNISGSIAPYVKDFNRIPTASMTMDNAALLTQTGTIKIASGFSGGPFISDFSSWGVLPNLELKPEITAHGGNITSSVIGGGHQSMNGTSMSAPNMAGAITLIRQFLKEKYPEKSAVEIATISNQLMMSTATIARNEDGNPYSPRKQGAGLADIYNAVRTDSYLYVEGKTMTKLSLGDDPEKTGQYNMSFHLTNTSALPRTFKLSTTSFTETLSSDKKTVAEKAYMFKDSKVNYSVNGQASGGTVVVGGYGDVTVGVTLTLSEKSKDYLNNTFANGMYVEGFVSLTPLSGEPQIELSIPYLAFYGDWTVAPMMDHSVYDIGASARDTAVADRDKLKAAVYAHEPVGTFWEGAQAMVLGQYAFKYPNGTSATDADANEDKAALSSATGALTRLDGIYAGLFRNAKNLDIDIYNSLTGHIVYEQNLTNVRKTYNRGGGTGKTAMMPGLVLMNFEPARYGLADNAKYTLSMTGKLDWEGEQNNLSNNFTFSFYMDSQKPLLERIEYRKEKIGDKERHYLDVFVYDNHYVQAMSVSTFKEKIYDSVSGALVDVSGETLLVDGLIPVDSSRNSVNKVTLDVTDNWELISRNKEQIAVEFFDYAMNYSMFAVDVSRTELGSIGFTKDTAAVDINGTVDLKQFLTATPEYAMLSGTDFRNLIWTVDGGTLKDGVASNSVLKVYDGFITGVSEGTTVVTVTSVDGKKSASIIVNVSNKKAMAQISLSGLKQYESFIDGYETLYDADGAGYSSPAKIQIAPVEGMYHLTQGDKGTFSVSALPWNITEDISSKIVWKSSNINIVSVKQDNDNPMKADFHVRMGTSASVTITAEVGYIKYEFKIAINTVFKVEEGVLKEYNGRGLDGVVEIPKNLNITSIGTQAFYSTYSNNFLSDIKKIIIPSGVATLEAGAFFQVSGLKEVELPDTVTTIASYSFAYCMELETINLDNVEIIEPYAFTNTRLKNIGSLAKMKTIGDYAFFGDEATPQFTSVDLSNVSYVGPWAFRGCSMLSDIKFSEKIVIGNLAFANVGIETLIVPFGKIAYGAFSQNSKLRSVVFQADVYIDSYAFFECTNITDVEFKGKCSYIGVAAFFNNVSLTSIRLPNGLKKLDQLAFGNCVSLKNVLISAGADFKLTASEKYNEDTRAEGGIAQFIGCTSLERFTVDESNSSFATDGLGILYDKSKTTLIMCPPALKFENNSFSTTMLPASVKIIGDYAFAQKTDLANVASIAGIEKIGAFAFFNCEKLVWVNFATAGTTLKYIGESAFEGCTELNSLGTSETARLLTSAEKLEYIGDQAFTSVKGTSNKVTLNLGTLNLKYLGFGVFADSIIYSVSLPASISSISAGLFYNCRSLESVIIPGNYTEIGMMAFYNAGITDIILSSALETIGEEAFSFSYLTKITIPGKVSNIGAGAFAYCDALTMVTVEEGVKSIGTKMFMGCIGLVKVELPSSVITLESDAFLQCRLLADINLDKVQTFNLRALADTAIRHFYAPEAIYLGSDLFFDSYYFESANIKLESVNAPKAIKVDDNAFRYCYYLTEILVPSATYIGHQAFYLTSYSSDNTIIDISSAEYIGAAAFSLTSMKELVIPASLKRIAETAFVNILNLERFIVEQGNSYFFTDKGILYSHLPFGGYQLEAVPEMLKFTDISGNQVFKYTVLDDTVRIAEGAFYFNRSLFEVVLPRTLKSIGAGAFLDTSIKTYQFLSLIAPALEAQVNSGMFDYGNFTSPILSYPILTMIYPKNGKGYDSVIYTEYFVMRIDSHIAMDDSTFEVFTAINGLSNVITLADKNTVSALRAAYSGLAKDQLPLITNYSKLTDAEVKIALLESVDSLITKINSLPKDISSDNKAQVESLIEVYNGFTDEQKRLVTNSDILLAAQASLGDDIPKNNTAVIVAVILGVILAGGALFSFFAYKSRTQNKSGSVKG